MSDLLCYRCEQPGHKLKDCAKECKLCGRIKSWCKVGNCTAKCGKCDGNHLTKRCDYFGFLKFLEDVKGVVANGKDKLDYNNDGDDYSYEGLRASIRMLDANVVMLSDICQNSAGFAIYQSTESRGCVLIDILKKRYIRDPRLMDRYDSDCCFDYPFSIRISQVYNTCYCD